METYDDISDDYDDDGDGDQRKGMERRGIGGRAEQISRIIIA